MKKNDKKFSKAFSWINTNLELRQTEKKGWGIFSKKNIDKDETLAIFGGYVLTLDQESKLPEKFRDGGPQISENYVICSMDHVENTDYFNHSCQPNSGFKGQICLVSMRKITKDEEITFDYAMCLFSKKKKNYYSFSCKCMHKNCRKIITSNDWKNKNLQKKYKGYFQKYLEDKMKV